MRIPSVFEKALITFLDNDATGGSICRAETLRLAQVAAQAAAQVCAY
jgi:hypothetical protein